MKQVTVTLKQPLRDHKGPVTSFTFREPKFGDYMELGDPRAPIVNGERVYMRPIPETVKDYAERLGVGIDPNILAGAGLEDAMEIQKVILGFFQNAESAKAEKMTPSSSSDAA